MSGTKDQIMMDSFLRPESADKPERTALTARELIVLQAEMAERCQVMVRLHDGSTVWIEPDMRWDPAAEVYVKVIKAIHHIYVKEIIE